MRDRIGDAMSLSFGVLGPLWAEDDRGRLSLKGPRHRAVLARLLVARGRVVPVTRLVDDLWEDDPPENATGAIQTFVAALRRVLEPDRPPRQPARVLVTEPPGYALRIAADQTDAGRFESAVRHAGELLAADDAAEAVSELDAALELWQGPAYAEFSEFAWVRAEIGRLDALRLLAVEQRARALLALGNVSDAVAAMEAHLLEHPLREQAWQLLALALYRGGRQADALAALRKIRTLLRAELGVDPGPELRALESAILAQDPELDAPIRRAHLESRTNPPAALANSDGRRTYSEGAAPRSAGVFVGREPELARLHNTAQDRAAHGGVGLALISGMEGAGKTALAQVFSAALAAEGWLTAWGPSPADRGTPPNWPWTRIAATLAELGGMSDPAAASRDRGVSASSASGAPGTGPAVPLGGAQGNPSAGDVEAASALESGADRERDTAARDVEAGRGLGTASTVDAGAEGLVGVEGFVGVDGGVGANGGAAADGGVGADGGAGEDFGVDPAVLRFRARQEAVEYVRAVAGRGPVLLVFDDLHQAGEETLELVSALVTARIEGAVLVVGVYRGTDVGAGLTGALARWARAEPVRITLGGLSSGETGELVHAVAGVDMESEAARRIHRRGNGNPFFTREMARLLREEGEQALQGIPAGVRDVVRQRMTRLTAGERTVLEQAAVIGVEIDREVLMDLAGDATAVLDAVDAALRAGFLVESDSGQVAFEHAVVRDVLYREISGPRRAAWRGTVGELLERAGAEPATLAYHFVRADSRATAARAARYSLAAGREAERVFAPHEAARWFAAAATAFTRDGDLRGKLEATMGFGRAAAFTGDLQESRNQRAQALRDVETLDDPELTARLLAAFDVPALWTDNDDPRLAEQVVAVAERTLAQLPDAAAELRSRLLTTIALELRAADSERGRDAARDAERLARSLDDPALLAFALNARFMQTFHRAGLAPERARIAAEIIDLSRAHDLVSFEVLGHLIAVQSHSALADFATADAHAAAADALGDKYGLTLVSVFTRWYSALRQSLSAPYAEAESAYRAAAAALPGSAMPGLEHGLLPLALLCLRLRHDLPLDPDPATDWGPHEQWVRPLLLLAEGRDSEAREAVRALPAPPSDLLLELRLCLVARAALALDERGLCADLRDRLLPAAGELAGAGTGLVTLEPVADYLDRLTAALA
ncbi:BTAD domain-containing putative transcriptional regulator [Nocardia sp. NPDC050406]|uniref:BTAD domain-containing putative transcriptional regulator n=1 Tax=Nocardia sp. NPDC050406 TaxID=3364318 RepID=UPI003797AA2C